MKPEEEIRNYIMALESERDAAIMKLDQLRIVMKSTTIFHNGAEWVTILVGDMPTYRDEDEAAAAAVSGKIQPPLQALSSMDALEAERDELKNHNIVLMNHIQSFERQFVNLDNRIDNLLSEIAALDIRCERLNDELKDRSHE